MQIGPNSITQVTYLRKRPRHPSGPRVLFPSAFSWASGLVDAVETLIHNVSVTTKNPNARCVLLSAAASKHESHIYNDGEYFVRVARDECALHAHFIFVFQYCRAVRLLRADVFHGRTTRNVVFYRRHDGLNTGRPRYRDTARPGLSRGIIIDIQTPDFSPFGARNTAYRRLTDGGTVNKSGTFVRKRSRGARRSRYAFSPTSVSNGVSFGLG